MILATITQEGKILQTILQKVLENKNQTNIEQMPPREEMLNIIVNSLLFIMLFYEIDKTLYTKPSVRK